MHAVRNNTPTTPALPVLGLAEVIVAEVIVAEGRACRVRLAAGGESAARVAASCLVQPCAGDQVALLAAEGAEVPYVWAVLERRECGPLGVAVPEGLSISAPAGAVVVSAERVEVLGRQRLGMTAPQVELETRSLRLGFADPQATGAEASLRVETLRLVSKSVTALLERVMTRLRRSYRVVEELEHMSGRQLDYKVSGNFSVRGKNNLITAEELVKLDGKQLHLG